MNYIQVWRLDYGVMPGKPLNLIPMNHFSSLYLTNQGFNFFFFFTGDHFSQFK